MFYASSSPGTEINETIVIKDPTDTPPHTTSNVSRISKNLPINLRRVFKIDTSEFFLVKGDIHNEPQFQIFRIHFMDEKGHSLHTWEYKSEKQRNVDFSKLITKL